MKQRINQMVIGLNKCYVLLCVFFLLSCHNKKDQQNQSLSADMVSVDLLVDTTNIEMKDSLEDVDDFWRYYNTETEEGIQRIKSLGEDIYKSYSRLMAMELPSEEEINIGLVLIEESLKDRAFKKVSDELFAERMLDVFGISSLADHPNIYHSKGYSIYAIDPIINDGEAYLDNANNIYISDSNFIFSSFYLFNIIDIQATKDSGLRKIKFPEYLIHRNNYIFYNNRESLHFLQIHDKDFLRNLVEVYDYQRDEELLDWVSNKEGVS